MRRIQLSAPLSPYGHAEEYDVRQVKTALNRLGYYMPPPETGIDGARDRALFAALDEFRRENGLAQSPWLKPRDETVRALNKAAERREPVRYIWRTCGDDRVRDGHAAHEGRIFTRAFPPPGGHPGEDYNCRCWAELVVEDKIEKESLPAPPEKNIPGTDIPDHGIPEQGYPGSRHFDPHRPPSDGKMDPYLERKPPRSIDPGMPVFESLPWTPKRKSI